MSHSTGLHAQIPPGVAHSACKAFVPTLMYVELLRVTDLSKLTD
jgi:hypothetical protein